MDKDIQALVKARGASAQAHQTMEELAELIVALSHFLRGRVQHTGEIQEEVADVEIMLAQVKYAFGLHQADIDTIKQRKVQRELGRLRAEALRQKDL